MLTKSTELDLKIKLCPQDSQSKDCIEFLSASRMRHLTKTQITYRLFLTQGHSIKKSYY